MIQIILFGVLAFLLGVGGGTGLRILTAPRHLPAPHAGADSTAGVHASESSPVTGSPAPAVSRHSADSSAAAAQSPASPARVAPASVARPATTAMAPEAITEPQQFKQVGNILLAMKPEEAGKILSYLSDDHVEGILRSMGPRQAATVLAQVPSVRAAQLSRRLLAPTAGGAER